MNILLFIIGTASFVTLMMKNGVKPTLVNLILAIIALLCFMNL